MFKVVNVVKNVGILRDDIWVFMGRRKALSASTLCCCQNQHQWDVVVVPVVKRSALL